jgi:tryptophanyl-tRNA synthetase
MSKSAAPDAAGVIRMRDEPRLIQRKVSRAVTDSDSEVRYDPEAKPGVSNLLDILAAVSGGDPTELAGRFTSYGELKKHTAEAVIAMLEPIQRRADTLLVDEPRLLELLRRGAEKASAQADPVLARARSAIGLI